MPNWCDNKLVVRGKRTDVAGFAHLIDCLKPSSGMFHEFLPMPNELNGTRSPPQIVSESEYQEYLNGKEAFGGTPITQQMHDEYVCRFCPPIWYSWACHNWGTKWEVNMSDCDCYMYRNGCGYRLLFTTAWSPPIPVIAAMKKRFPNLTFALSYKEDGMGFSGQEVW